MSEPTISVTVEAPEGLPALRPLVSCEPKTQDEFNAVVEACGGPTAFTYFSDTSAHAKLANDVTLILYSFESRPVASRPVAPSIGRLQMGGKL